MTARRRLWTVGTAVTVGLAPAAAQPDAAPQPPTRPDVTALFARLDDAFERGDADAFLAAFDPVHPTLHARFATRIRQVLSLRVSFERASELQRHWQLGPHGVSLVATTTRLAARQDLPPVREHALAVTRRTADESTAITLYVDVDESVLAQLPDADQPLTPKHAIRCSTCNYEIDAGQDWLMVPNAKQSSGCLESLTFFALDVDLSVELSIHLDRAPDPAPPAVRLVTLCRDRTGDADAAPSTEPWIPPAYTLGVTGPPPLLDGARCTIDEDGTPHAELFLAVFGRVGYLFAVRGSAVTAERRSAAIGRLLDSFMLLDPELSPDTIAARITGDRQGGDLVDGGYVNRRFGVRCDAPGAWQPRLAAAHYAFDVVFSCPADHGHMRVKGMEPPRGMERWTRAAADRMVRSTLERAGLRVVEDSGWQGAADGFDAQREIVARRGDADPRYALRLGFAPDLLVLAEADANTAHGLRLAREAFGSLRRER